MAGLSLGDKESIRENKRHMKSGNLCSAVQTVTNLKAIAGPKKRSPLNLIWTIK